MSIQKAIEAAKIKNTKSQKQFISELVSILGNDKYDFSKVVYGGSHAAVEIVCIKHNKSFWQKIYYIKHEGAKCPDCIQEEKTKKFIEQAISIHGDKYDYSDTIYRGVGKSVKIKCKIHDKEFLQRAGHHIYSGAGCRECAHEQINKANSISKEEFLEQSHKIHNGKYDYSKVEFINDRTKVEIICPMHKSFWQIPLSHRNGMGCQKCGIESAAKTRSLGLEEFIRRSTLVYGDKYDYSETEYVSATEKVKIYCKTHKKYFWLYPQSHMEYNCECPDCTSKNISNGEVLWLDSKRISERNRSKSIFIENKRYWVDAYIPRSKNIYEFYGDYWHGNPNRYDPEDINASNYKSFGDLYKRTLEREAELKAAGYNIISIWESEWNALQKKKQKKTG